MVPAEHHYFPPQDGLTLPWWGTVYLNPPWGDLGPWLERAALLYQCGVIEAAVALVPLRTHRVCFRPAWTATAVAFLPPVAFPEYAPDSYSLPCVLLYWGPDVELFSQVVAELGALPFVLGPPRNGRPGRLTPARNKRMLAAMPSKSPHDPLAEHRAVLEQHAKAGAQGALNRLREAMFQAVIDDLPELQRLYPKLPIRALISAMRMAGLDNTYAYQVIDEVLLAHERTDALEIGSIPDTEASVKRRFQEKLRKKTAKKTAKKAAKKTAAKKTAKKAPKKTAKKAAKKAPKKTAKKTEPKTGRAATRSPKPGKLNAFDRRVYMVLLNAPGPMSVGAIARGVDADVRKVGNALDKLMASECAAQVAANSYKALNPTAGAPTANPANGLSKVTIEQYLEGLQVGQTFKTSDVMKVTGKSRQTVLRAIGKRKEIRMEGEKRGARFVVGASAPGGTH